MKCVCYHISQVYFWRFHIWIWIGQYDWEHGSDVRHPAMDRIVCLSYHCQKAFLSLHSLYFVFLACVMNLFTFFRPVFRLLLFSSFGASVWPASYQPCTPQGLRLSLFQTRHWKYIQLVGELTNEPLKRGKHLSSNNQHNWEIWMELRAASHAFLIKKERHWRKVGGNSQLNHFHFCSVLKWSKLKSFQGEMVNRLSLVAGGLFSHTDVGPIYHSYIRHCLHPYKNHQDTQKKDSFSNDPSPNGLKSR